MRQGDFIEPVPIVMDPDEKTFFDTTNIINREIIRIDNKLKDTTLTQEEKLTLTALKKEKIEEFLKLCELYREIKDKPEPEHKPKTREENIKQQKKHIERIKKVIEQCKKDNNISLLNSMVSLLERQKENLKFLEEYPDNTPKVYRDFLGNMCIIKPKKNE